MNTKRLSEKSLSIIDQYLNFSLGGPTCSVPYYNNKHLELRGQLRAKIGKGSPKEIFDEAQSQALLEKIDAKIMNSEELKKFLVDRGLGADCSGLAYYILNAESESREKHGLDRHLAFPFRHGMWGKLRSKLHPVENTDVATLAHDENSRMVALKEIEPGDMITVIGNNNHILIIHQVEYQNFIPTSIHYTHTVAWPTDGQYGHGVRQGLIEILDPLKTLTEQKWTEAGQIGGLAGNENYTFSHAKNSQTEIRRLKWL